MFSRKSHLIPLYLSAVFVLVLSAVPGFAIEDPDPNSPTPILLSLENETRALAVTPRQAGRVNLSKVQPRAFAAGSRVILYVTNLSLMDGEGANAFRIYVEDNKGHKFRFPVLNITPLDDKSGIYALTVELRDTFGFWEEGPRRGDLLVSVTWRGLASNSLKLGYGSTGGEIREPEGKPEPFSKYQEKPAEEPPGGDYVGYRWSGDRKRFLEQATFGPTLALDERIRRIGLRTWLAEQFEMPYPSGSDPYPNIMLKPTNIQPDCDNNPTVPDVPPTCFRDHYLMYHPQIFFYKNAFYGDAQLKHRVTWALNQIWVISGVDTQQSSHMIEYHQQVSRNAFGNWRNLMYDVTLNPGMGNFLDMMRSTRQSPNENFAREILQLFNVGLFMMNPDGTLQLDGQGNPIPTYTQDTVNNFTKVLTGWRDCRPTDFQASCPDFLTGTQDYKDPMSLNTNNHDLTAKSLLVYPGSTTTTVAACSNCTTQLNTYNYAYASLNQAIDNIYNHPNVAPFVGKLLIQHLVTSDPTPAYVGRISAVFNANRSNPSQMKEVVKAILLDPEARGDAKTDPGYGKLREPVQLATNLLRHFGVRSFDGMTQSDGHINPLTNALGQNVFNAPTVFNYYPPDYVVPGTSVLAPEFGIYTTGTSIGRANFANIFAASAGYGVSMPDRPNGTSIDLSELVSFSTADPSGNQLLDHLNRKMLHSTMSAGMKSTILTAVLNTTNHTTRAQRALYLVTTSSQYQVQR